MRIYTIDGDTCFDTDDLHEARLLDSYSRRCKEEGIFWAERAIAGWLDDQSRETYPTAQLIGVDEIARRIRLGEWRPD